MPNLENAVSFGFQDVVFFLESDIDVYEGDKIVMDGAIAAEVSNKEEKSEVYADNRVYYVRYNKQGKEGTFTFYKVPEDFEEKVLGRKKDPKTGIILESREDKPVKVAAAYRVEGDKYATYRIMYGITFSTPEESYNTTNENAEPSELVLNFTATGLEKMPYVTGKTGKDTPQDIKDNWFNKAMMPKDLEIVSGE